MSTKLTQAGVPMVESHSLQLIIAAAKVQESTSLFLSKSLKTKGYRSVSPSLLNFLSTLECGANYGSEIARALGVSRQMVAKTVRELCKAGYLEQRDGLGKQKEIVFTETGEMLMSDARQLLADVDRILNKEVGQVQLSATLSCLENVQKLMNNYKLHGK
ncbi:MAG: DNA-binding MarR family transcriptional regulator [Paraglaciecola sp.]|jgi:DNA-binding MarR family transcriptional regulator